jgi:hypothetical protein
MKQASALNAESRLTQTPHPGKQEWGWTENAAGIAKGENQINQRVHRKTGALFLFVGTG